MRARLIWALGASVSALLLVRCGGSTSTIGSSDGGGSSSGSSGSSGSSSGASGSSSSSSGASGSSSGSSGSSSGDASTDGAPTGDCNPACPMGRSCCHGQCVNENNDPLNCGGCDVKCTGLTPYCAGTCQALPCELGGDACKGAGQFCCGQSCCNAGDQCCEAEGPVSGAPMCHTPTAKEPTCPQGCAPACVSDRDAKRELAPADERAVLDAICRMPITTWSYASDRANVRHIGPMAQDFKSSLGVGASDKSYDPVDAHGAAFASIKALSARLDEQQKRIDKLERENHELRARVCK